MQNLKVWDPFVRVFHWSLVIGFAANAMILDDDGKTHQWVGYIIVTLVVLRLVWGLAGTRYARFSSFPPSVSASLGQIRETLGGTPRVHVGHTPLGALMIYNLLLSMLVIGVSGWLMTTDMFWGVEWPDELHETAVVWAEVSIILHIAAVLFESWRTSVNLPRAMITGCKNIPKGQEMAS